MLRSNICFHLEPTSKVVPTVNFFSKAGKIRLSRIWEDQRLNDQMTISSWISVGLSESMVKENVSDYMQQFLQNRYMRYGSSNMCGRHFPQKMWNYQIDQPQHKQQDVLPIQRELKNALFKERMNERINKENERVRKSILEGKQTPPSDFDEIVKHPVYKANRTEERIREFERNYRKNGPEMFARKTDIRNVEEENTEEEGTQHIQPSGNGALASKPVSTLDIPISPLPFHIDTKIDGKASRTSSGFFDATISPTKLENDNSNAVKFHKLMLDERINFNSTKIECPWGSNTITWVSPYVNIVLDEEDIPEMYKLAEDVLWLFRRKLRFSKQCKEKIEEFQRLIESDTD